jgi:hypothetical protein
MLLILLLAKRNLKDGVLDRFASHLTTEHVELARRDFEVGRGIFVLKKMRDVDKVGVED